MLVDDLDLDHGEEWKLGGGGAVAASVMRKCAVPRDRARIETPTDANGGVTSRKGNSMISTWPSTSVAPWIMGPGL